METGEQHDFVNKWHDFHRLGDELKVSISATFLMKKYYLSMFVVSFHTEDEKYMLNSSEIFLIL